jgi:iron(III) transport system ATP-binding protein
VKPGPVKAAIRPEAWVIGDASDRSAPGGAGGLAGIVSKQAYLGSFHELTVETGLGPIFVVCADTAQDWASGDTVTLSLTGRGVSVVPG